MIWQPETLLLVLWAIMARRHAYLIKNLRPIKHGWWAFLSGVLIAGGEFWAWPRLQGFGIYAFAITQGCGRLVTFNVLLNAFRGEPFDYESGTTTSVLDQLERKLFGGRVWLLEVLLAAFYLILQLFINDQH